MTLGEGTLLAATGSQEATGNRWGDYSSMSVDPNGCTFWYTQEYYVGTSAAFGGGGWNTRVGSFTNGSGTLGEADPHHAGTIRRRERAGVAETARDGLLARQRVAQRRGGGGRRRVRYVPDERQREVHQFRRDTLHGVRRETLAQAGALFRDVGRYGEGDEEAQADQSTRS